MLVAVHGGLLVPLHANPRQVGDGQVILGFRKAGFRRLRDQTKPLGNVLLNPIARHQLSAEIALCRDISLARQGPQFANLV